MTTNWVITNECTNFPILYHWRILQSRPGDLNTKYWSDIKKYSRYWENCSAICKRVEALKKASAYIVLFLEYIPQNLHDWLSAQIKTDDNAVESAVTFVDQHLKITNDFMKTHHLIHFDAHFENILTDGELLYFSDFGLALSSKFYLSISETEFLKRHQTYDQACAVINLLHCIITSLFGKKQWKNRLCEYIAGKHNNGLSAITTIIKRYAPIALVMDDFFQKLKKGSKSTPYPETQVEQLLKTLSETS